MSKDHRTELGKNVDLQIKRIDINIQKKVLVIDQWS